jgi:ribosome-binding factor A
MDRIDRISEEVRRELSDIIQNEIRDPRLPEFVSVTAVRVVKDLKHAKVHISVLGTPEQKQDAIRALVHAAGFIRREIGQRVRIRYTPELHFVLDDSIEHGIRISQLIADTMAKSPAPAVDVELPQTDGDESDDGPLQPVADSRERVGDGTEPE